MCYKFDGASESQIFINPFRSKVLHWEFATLSLALSYGNIKDKLVRRLLNIAITLLETVVELFTESKASYSTALARSTLDVCESLPIVHSIGRLYCTACRVHSSSIHRIASIYILRSTILIQRECQQFRLLKRQVMGPAKEILSTVSSHLIL